MPGLGQRRVERDRVVADREQEPVAARPVRVLGPVAQLVGVDHGEHVGAPERLADVALALHLAHVQGVVPDPVGRLADRAGDGLLVVATRQASTLLSWFGCHRCAQTTFADQLAAPARSATVSRVTRCRHQGAIRPSRPSS